MENALCVGNLDGYFSLLISVSFILILTIDHKKVTRSAFFSEIYMSIKKRLKLDKFKWIAEKVRYANVCVCVRAS